MPLTEHTIQTLSVIFIGLTWVELLIITLSYWIAFLVKKTFGVGAILGYFAVSTLIYFLLFVRLILQLLDHKSFFESCELFFIMIGITRILSGAVLLISIWKQHKEK